MSDTEKEAAETQAEESENATGAQDVDLKALGGSFVQDKKDYEALFMKDARQRAHDAELAALASLAIIRSSNSRERSSMLATLEREQYINPREVNRHLQADDSGGTQKK